MDNPMRFIDPDGMSAGDYYLNDGTHLGNDGKSDDKVYLVDNSKTNYKPGTKSNPTVILDKDVKEVKGIGNKELNMRAMLKTISTAEGHGKLSAYNVKYGGSKFSDFSTHPGGAYFKGIFHSPAGAYSITEGTFKGLSKETGITDFSPSSQDRLAVALIKDVSGAYKAVTNGDISTSFTKLSGQWPSLPGGSQQGLNFNDALNTFKTAISNELNQNSALATPQGNLFNN